MRRRRHDACIMKSTAADVVLFAFHDAGRTAEVVTAAGNQPGVVSVAVVGRSPDCEVRVISRVGDEMPDVRSLASVLAVLDVLSWPLSVLTGSPRETQPVTLPDSDDGIAAFGRLVPRGALVILLAVCKDSEAAIDSFERQVGAALFPMPGDGDDRLRVPVGRAWAER